MGVGGEDLGLQNIITVIIISCLFLGVGGGFLGGSVVKNLPANAEDLGWEDPLEKEMATHSSIIAWEIPWTEEIGGLQSWGSQKLDMT